LNDLNFFWKINIAIIVTILNFNHPQTPTQSRTLNNGTPHSPKVSINNPYSSKNPSFNSYDYTQVASVCPFPILKGRLTLIMDMCPTPTHQEHDYSNGKSKEKKNPIQ
jgi:hypothetical protein